MESTLHHKAIYPKDDWDCVAIINTPSIKFKGTMTICVLKLNIIHNYA